MAPRSDRPFSSRGELPTEFECGLFATAIARAVASPRPIDSPWLYIGQRIGVPALAVVFDELGGEKVHVPTRAAWFEGLAQQARDTRIRELLAAGVPHVTIASEFRLTKGRVSQIAAEVKRPGRR
ncbi:MAG: hypothetical protein ACK51F_10765 [Rhodospirillales bacterium]|jgi:hypothetical protein